MTHADTGHYGAKVQSWRKANPRELLKKIMDATNPGDKEGVAKAFRDEVKSDEGEEYLDSIIEYWFTNNYNSLMDERKIPLVLRRKRAAVATAKKLDEFREVVKKHVKQEALFLLDTMLPTGKTLAKSTFGECAKLGGALAKIGGKGKPNEVVGKKLTDAQLKKLQAA